VEAVHLLLERKGDVTLKNTYDHSPLDLAIDNLHHDVVITMLRSKRFGFVITASMASFCLRFYMSDFTDFSR